MISPSPVMAHSSQLCQPEMGGPNDNCVFVPRRSTRACTLLFSQHLACVRSAFQSRKSSPSVPSNTDSPVRTRIPRVMNIICSGASPTSYFFEDAH